jgi:hypothetical protein
MYRINLNILDLFLLLTLELPILILAVIVATAPFCATLRSFSRHSKTWRNAHTYKGYSAFHLHWTIDARVAPFRELDSTGDATI